MPSIEDVLFIAFAVKLLLLGNAFLNDADTGWHIRSGDMILQNMSVPQRDIFSYTMYGQPWMDHEWLSQVIFSVLHQAWGLTGVILLTVLVLSCTFYSFYRFLLEKQVSLLLSVILTFMTVGITSVHWLGRPHIFSLYLTLIWYRQLDRHEKTGEIRFLYPLPFIMMLWVNLHGAYITGFILTGIYFTGTVLQRYFENDSAVKSSFRKKAYHQVALAGVCILTALINPYGFRMLLFPFEFMRLGYIRDNIQEWASPDFHETILYELPLLLLMGGVDSILHL